MILYKKEGLTTQDKITAWNEKCRIDASYYPAFELCINCDLMAEFPPCSKYYGIPKSNVSKN